MKKTKLNNSNKSDKKLSITTEIKMEEPVIQIPLDVLTFKVLSLRIPEKQETAFALRIIFYDQLILDTVITSLWARDVMKEKVIVHGSMKYDPSNYEKMCLFADFPLIVTIQPVSSSKPNITALETTKSSLSQNSALAFERRNTLTDVFSCNVDILPIFLDTDEMHVKMRMQPAFQTSVLNAISWDNLPLLTMELTAKRNAMNAVHHSLLAEANYFKFTLVGCYNLPNINHEFTVYTAASKTTMFNETKMSIIKFDEGYRDPKHFTETSFYPKWESLRLDDSINSQNPVKLDYGLNSIQNDNGIFLEKYLTESAKCNNVIWASFHRTLLMKENEPWLQEFLRQYSWPFELRISGNTDFSMMGFLDLFKLLYPGVDTVRLAVPLKWLDEVEIKQKCGCDTLLPSNELVSSTISTVRKSSKLTTELLRTSTDDSMYQKPTGNDGNSAFVIVEVSLQRPFKKLVIPPHISNTEIKDMLKEMETQQYQRECTGRGQLIRDWHDTVKRAANSLRRIPYYGSTDFCTFDRQLSLTRARVEIVTSFFEEAAIYVNNNFVVEDFLDSDDKYQELLLMAHACLASEASKAMCGDESWPKVDPLIRAARHARYFQDTKHAAELYFHVLSQNKRNANYWRELGTCLQELDPDWADACFDKSLVLNPRHPLTLLSKGCIILKKDPEAAEQFFLALLFFHPFWLVGLIAANAFFLKREYFEIADKIMEWVKRTKAEGSSELLNIARAWEHELGDWWESTPLLPGTSLYYDAADLLLRIRAINLAEVCIAQAFTKYGGCPVYYHLLALCCRLRGDIDNALCHIQEGIKKFGEKSFLRALEAECYHVQKNNSASVASFEKVGANCGSYCTLLSILSGGSERSRLLLAELLRRQPSAYSWLAFADEWLALAKEERKKTRSLDYESSAVKYAIACATEALKLDKKAGRAWALLAKLVTTTARKVYCARMAVACGYTWPTERLGSPSRITCHRLGKTLRECRCKSCTLFTL